MACFSRPSGTWAGNSRTWNSRTFWSTRQQLTWCVTPEAFDVLVTTNFYGDILSDLTSELSGSLGLAGSVMASDKLCCAQAQHGSAPDIAGRNIANPASMMLSIAMLLSWIGDNRDRPKYLEAGAVMTAAVDKALEDPNARNRRSRRQRIDRRVLGGSRRRHLRQHAAPWAIDALPSFTRPKRRWRPVADAFDRKWSGAELTQILDDGPVTRPAAPAASDGRSSPENSRPRGLCRRLRHRGGTLRVFGVWRGN